MDDNVHGGHRSRMRRKLIEYGDRIFDTYELLEMLLYYSIPVRDTNPISKGILSSFGSLDKVLAASEERLCKCDGIGPRSARLIHGVGEAVRFFQKKRLAPVFDDYKRCADYLIDYFADKSCYCTVMMSLDSAMRLISIDKIFDLDCVSAGVRGKEFVDCAVKNKAAVVILAHNHPNGPCFPSDGDRQTTYMLTDVFTSMGIALAEHYVISGGRAFGMINRVAGKLSSYLSIKKFFSSKKNYLDLSDNSGEFELVPLENNVSLSSTDDDIEYLDAMLELFGAKEHKALAKALGDKYSCLLTLAEADVNELIGICSSEAVAVGFRLIVALTKRRVTDKIKVGCKYSMDEISAYLRALLFGSPRECVYMLSFNSAEKLIHTDLLGEGTVNSTGLLPRMVMDIAVRHSATNVILAHNHPGGEALPSNADIYTTSQLIGVLESSGIKLLGHFVVAGFEISDALNPAPLKASFDSDYMDESFEVAARIRNTVDRY